MAQIVHLCIHYAEDYSRSPTCVSSEPKVASRANQSQPKVEQSDNPVKHDIPIHMTYHLVIVIPISPQLTAYIHQIPQLLPLLMSQLQTPCTHLYPLWVKFILRDLIIAPMACVMKWFIIFPNQILIRLGHLQLRIVWVMKDIPATIPRLRKKSWNAPDS